MFFCRVALLIMIHLLVILHLVGCATFAPELDPEKHYMHDLKMNVNGETFIGTGVPKLSDRYKIEIESVGDISNLSIKTCARDKVFTPKRKWFDSKKKFTYMYIPKDLERGKACLLDIGSYENRLSEEGNRHSFGVLDFDSDIENLPADIQCNGETYHTDPKSVSICQNKVGLLNKIVFDHRVKASKKNQSKCNVLMTTDEKTYIYKMPLGNCTYYFCDKHKNCHRHSTFGYKELLMRGEPKAKKEKKRKVGPRR